MQIQIYQIASGSSGNCVLISSEKTRFLLDAGTNAKYIKTALSAIGVSVNELDAIILTHEHFDHISALKVLSKHISAPVYASKGTAEALIRGAGCRVEQLRPFDAGSGFFVGDFFIESFCTSHDACDSVGYVINCGNRKVGYATDLGRITGEIVSVLKGSETVLLESNHDTELLKSGSYPYYLKRRILSDTGHLSNADCADAALEIAKSGTRKIILSHLSAENNTVKIAYDTTRSRLDCAGAGEEVELLVAKRRLG